MSNSISIDEPFQLSAYTSSYRGKQKSPITEHVFVTSIASRSGKSKSINGEGLVTVATQADGIHLVDISSLHSVVSHTLGPSTSFSCPAVTLTSEEDSNEYSTYAVIEASPELSNSVEDAGRVVWKWVDSLSSSVSISAEKQKVSRVIVPSKERVHGIYTVPELPSRILGVTQSGTILLLDSASLEEKASLPISAEQPVSVYRTFVFASSTCTFGAKGTSSTVLIVSFDEDSLNLHVVSVDSDDGLSMVARFRLPQNREVVSDISDISCSETGSFSVLGSDGVWSSYVLSASGSSFQLRPLARPFKLANFGFTSISSSQKPNSATVSICALSSHHVLLVALSPSPSSAIHIQIWDLQFSVLLASHVLPVPSTFASSPLSLKLVHDDSARDAANSSNIRGQAILILSVSSSSTATTSKGSKTTSAASSLQNGGMSSLLVVPYLVPSFSTLAVALGKGSASKPWIQALGETAKDKKSEAEEGKAKVLARVKTAMENGKAKAAESAFLEWLKDAEGEKEEGEFEALLDYNFVKEVLEIVLPEKTLTVYPGLILKCLVERKAAVSSSMVEGGLLRSLRERNDWASIELCFLNVVDLPESDIIQTLVVLTKHHVREQQRRQSTGDAMQVDIPATTLPSTAVPSLSAFLSSCVQYPNTTSKGLVLALKLWVRDPQDAAAIAQVLENWIKALGQQRRVNGEVGLLPTNKDLEKNEHGVWVIKPQRRIAKKGGASANKKALPPLVKVIDFLQSFMDACFLQLLQHTPSHKLLQQLQLHLIEETTFSDVLEQLRGSLEPFAVGHQKSLREAAIPEKEKEKQRQKGDWRQRRNALPSVVGSVGTVGVYQVEELVL